MFGGDPVRWLGYLIAHDPTIAANSSRPQAERDAPAGKVALEACGDGDRREIGSCEESSKGWLPTEARCEVSERRLVRAGGFEPPTPAV